jgi:hypothetical protein
VKPKGSSRPLRTRPFQTVPVAQATRVLAAASMLTSANPSRVYTVPTAPTATTHTHVHALRDVAVPTVPMLLTFAPLEPARTVRRAHQSSTLTFARVEQGTAGRTVTSTWTSVCQNHASTAVNAWTQPRTTTCAKTHLSVSVKLTSSAVIVVHQITAHVA